MVEQRSGLGDGADRAGRLKVHGRQGGAVVGSSTRIDKGGGGGRKMEGREDWVGGGRRGVMTEVESSRVERSRPAVALEEESKTLAAGGKGLHGGYLAVEPRRHGARGILYVPHSMMVGIIVLTDEYWTLLSICIQVSM